MTEPKFDLENYQESIVVFLDLLGFKNRLETASGEALNEIGEFLYEIKNKAKKFAQDPNTERYLSGLKILTVSDCIIMALPDPGSQNNRLFNLFVVVKNLHIDLLPKEWIFRGFICKGKCHFEDGVLFGPAYNKAYQNESKHPFPRVIVEKELAEIYLRDVELTSKTKNPLLRSDFGGPYYIDYLNYDNFLETFVDKDGNKIAKEDARSLAIKYFADAGHYSAVHVKENKDKPGVAEKYEWLARYIEDSLPS